MQNLEVGLSETDPASSKISTNSFHVNNNTCCLTSIYFITEDRIAAKHIFK